MTKHSQGKEMRLLFDLGHPAHVHLFRNLINRLQDNGDPVFVASRDKDVTVRLCNAYGIHHTVLSKAYSGNFIGGIGELLTRTLKLLKIAMRFKPDALLGTSMSIGIVGRLIHRPSFVFSEDDAGIIPLFAHFVYPTCNFIVTPESLKHENYGLRHLTYPGYHELAYLHPDHFTPDPSVAHSIGLDIDQPFFILRFVSLKAHHDTKAEGLPVAVARKLVEMLSTTGKLLITAEGELGEDFKKYQFPLPPEKFHDVLAFASLYLGDSQTVSIEAAMLGVPSIRCNTFVGRIACLEELEHVHGLTKGFLPQRTDELLDTVRQWLADIDGLKHEQQRKRKIMLGKCVNLTDWLWSMLHEKLESN
jgi:uncharacterized protein